MWGHFSFMEAIMQPRCISIAHIIYALDTGGLENGLINLINHLPQEQYKHTIIALTTATSFQKRIQSKNVDVLCVDKHPGPLYRYYPRLFSMLKSIRPDIVHTRNLATIECQLLASVLMIPHRIHGEHGRDMSDLDGTNKKNIWIRKACRPFIHRYIALSNDIEHYLVNKINIDESKIAQIYNGVDVHRFTPLQKSNDKLEFISVGRLQKVKDYPCLIEAIRIFFVQNPEANAQFTIVGDGPERETCEQLVTRYELQNVVRFLGNQHDVANKLKQADVFVLSSLVEGISNTILEAMSTGLAVIATNVGGNAELITNQKTGLLTAPGDPQQLAAAFETVYHNTALRNHLQKNARNAVENCFSLEKMVLQYHQLYQQQVLDRESIQCVG